MDIGAFYFPTDWSIGPADAARALEERGYSTLMLPEHTHIPVSRRTPWPGGAPLPEEYRRTLDPFVGLTAAAAATTTLRIGTGICLVGQRDPIVLAKEVASLDVISGGRFTFGIGFGWNEDEMEHHGVPPKRRRAVVREKVLAMKALWTEDEASFEGEFVNFGPSWSWPKPIQKPYPPILLGGAGRGVVEAVIDYCDGWMPISGRADIAHRLEELRAAADDAGEDAGALRILAFGVRPDPKVLNHYAEAGVGQAVLAMPPVGRDEWLAALDQADAAIATWRGAAV